MRACLLSGILQKEKEEMGDLTSAPSEPSAVVACLVVLKHLEQVELVVVVLQVCLVQHCVPGDPVLTVHVSLE